MIEGIVLMIAFGIGFVVGKRRIIKVVVKEINELISDIENPKEDVEK